MKKVFLIAGLVACIGATNGYAAQSQVILVDYTCPDGCNLATISRSDGTTIAECRCKDGRTVDPEVTIQNAKPSSRQIQQVMSTSTLNQAVKEKKEKVPVRAATIEPTMTKKIVYEEIVSEDYAE